MSAVAPAPCIGTAWAPRTSRAAFPVTASAFAIAWEEWPGEGDARCSSCLKGAARLRPAVALAALLMLVRSDSVSV